jgi:hypothetical protein
MTVSQAPYVKILTYLSTGWTISHPGSSNFVQGPQNVRPHTGLCAQDSAFNKPNLLKICSHLSMFTI